ncbi:MAG TPA: hypothetical protein VEQ42_06485 [Pyrinomonadaceae bacterium]|nr:hypothetical protein [Pyrinomonadaceae bacterium]
MKCDYCQSACAEGDVKCGNCGAPFGERAAPDYRFCPHCKRHLLALGSPACNYCGRALPESFVKAREALLERISRTTGSSSPEELDELERDADGPLRRALDALFDLERKSKRK